MLPFLLGVVVPALIIGVIAFVLRPKGELVLDMPKYTYNQKFQTRIYVSSTWGEKKIEPYRVTPREDPTDANPLYDEIAEMIRESEYRMLAVVQAADILAEIGREQRKKLQLA